MAIEPQIKAVRDLKGMTIGITGVPSDYATLDTALRSAGLTRNDIKVVTVGYNLLPALLAHRVDAYSASTATSKASSCSYAASIRPSSRSTTPASPPTTNSSSSPTRPASTPTPPTARS